MYDLSVAPFYDDFQTSAKGKNYQKILFVPGKPVQARELTQIQSILQEQIKRHGDAIFQNGTVVQNGQVFYDNTITYLQISPTYASNIFASFASQLVGTTITGSSGVTALVTYYVPATATDPGTLYIKYNASNGNIKTFSVGEILYSTSLNVNFQINSNATAIGTGSVVSISDGIYYCNGYFIEVTPQTIVLDKYDSTPSYIIGLSFVENIVTASTDSTLYDNAAGFSNYAAPGADRYQIELVLSVRNIDYTIPNNAASLTFIPLMTVVNGQIQKQTNNTQYSDIEKMLARRTYDEAGDFVVNPFSFSTSEYRSNNRGQWITNIPVLAGDIVSNAGYYYTAMNSGYAGATPPTWTYGVASDGQINWMQVSNPIFNDGTTQISSALLADHISAEQNYQLLSSAGKAYINGFEVIVQNKTSTINPKARDISQISGGSIYSPTGLYVRVSNVAGIINTTSMTQVNLLDSNVVIRGTAWATKIVYDSGTIGTTSALYKLYLIDIKLNTGYDLIDDILTITSAAGFSGTINRLLVPLTGVVSTTSASATVTGSGTLFTQELKPYDIISINGVTVIVSTINSDTSLTLTTTFATTLTNVPILSSASDINGYPNYLSPMPHNTIQNTRNASGALDITYNVSETYVFTTSSTSYSLTLTTGETFTGTTGHIIVNSSNAIINASYTLDGTATILTISGLAASTQYTLIAQVKRSGSSAKQKTKTLTTTSIIVNATNVTDNNGNVLSTSYNINSSVIPLFYADVLRIEKVTLSGSTGTYNATGESDITSWFILNPNKTLEMYDLSTVTRKSNILPPNKSMRITFTYFAHSQGDFFSVDSYAGIPYRMIPTETYSGITFAMSDFIDTRPTRAQDGNTFNGTNGVVPLPIDSTVPVISSYSYYLPRQDIITLDQTGTFNYVKGVSGTNVYPKVNDNLLALADLKLSAYNINPHKDIYITLENHQRYTMKDIGDIDKRLANTEFYIALNQLEKDTSTLQIYDANGMSRYKAGFIADPFTSDSVLDTNNSDVKCGIDTLNGILNPPQTIQSVNLQEATGASSASRITSHYQITGDYVSLPYTEEVLISQTLASNSVNINPFAVFNWTGSSKITPSTDNWVDVINISYTKQI